MFQDLSFSSRWPAKNFFMCKFYTYLVEMVSSFSSLSGHCEDFRILTSKKLI